MAKTDQQRITDTLNFLQNTVLVTAAERNAIFQFIGAHLPAPNTPAYTQLSSNLSLGYHMRSDPNQRRVMARALFLIWFCMGHANGAFALPRQNASQIDQTTVQEQLANYIRKARCMFNAAGAQDVLNVHFPANPLAFLRLNKVLVRGSNAVDAANAPVNVQNFNFGYDPGWDRYVFQSNPLPNGFATTVESVTAFHWTDPRHHGGGAGPFNIANVNFTQLTGIRLSGANPMITTQFTGCAFCMAEHAGHLYCAHLSPAGVPGMAPNTTGPILAQRVMVANNGQFQNAGGANVRVFGRDNGHPPNAGGYILPGGGGAGSYMTIVGFPGGTSYQLYSQTTVNNAIHGQPVQIF